VCDLDHGDGPDAKRNLNCGKLSVAVALVGFFSGHGGPQGETDIAGHPKEGAAENDLGGVMSVTLFH
jgi:hypothetical protein